MKQRANTSQNKSKSRSVARCASDGLVDFLRKKYDNTIPTSIVTATHKIYGTAKPLSKQDRFIKRFSNQKGAIDTNKLLEYLDKAKAHEKGKGLSADAMKRVYDNCCNQDGKLTFEFIMKMGQSCGVPITERAAKAMVRKYGKNKDHLDLQDCKKINARRQERLISRKMR